MVKNRNTESPAASTDTAVVDPAEEAKAGDDWKQPAASTDMAVSAEPVLTPADVIDPRRHYSPDGVTTMLGIAAETTIDAIAAKRFGRLKPSVNTMLRGADILEWVQTDEVPYAITPVAAKVHAMQHPVPTPAPRRRAAERAFDENVELERRERLTRENDVLARYVSLLTHGPAEGDSMAIMREVVAVFGLDREDVTADCDLVAAAEKMEHRYESSTPRDALIAHKMTELKKRRPGFFDDGTPPKLRRPAASTAK